MGKTAPRMKMPEHNKGVSQTSKSHKPALTEAVVPDIEWRDSEVMVNDKVHKIPTTKEYLLKEFADVFPRSWKSTRTTIPY